MMQSHSATQSCANCGEPRDGHFCHHCGQSNRDFRKSLPPVMWEVLSEAFEVDGRIWRSARLLLFKPGALSVEFSKNRRADFVSPIRLYLFTSILFFFVLSMTRDIDQIDLQAAADRPIPASESSATLETEDTVEHAVTLDANTPILDPPGSPTELRQSRDSDTPSAAQQAAFRAILDPELHDDFDTVMAKEDSYGAQMLKAAMTPDIPFEDQTLSFVERFFYNQVVKAVAHPQTLLSELFDNVPLALFFLLPIYAVMLKLFYLGSRKFYVEHFVFALHLHSFAFLIFTITLFLPANPANYATVWGYLEDGCYLGFLAYYFVALLRYYEQSRRRTFVKFVSLLSLYSACLVPAALLVLLITLSTA